MTEDVGATVSEVSEITLAFWIIAATTLGETGGEALSMSLNLGYAVNTLIFLLPLFVLVALQKRATVFHPTLYWTVIVGTTLAGKPWRTLQIARSASVIRRINDSLRVSARLTWFMEVGDRYSFGKRHGEAKGRVVLLAGHPLLQHIGHGTWRLDERGHWLRRRRLAFFLA